MIATVLIVVNLVWFVAIRATTAFSLTSKAASFLYSTEQRGFFLQEDPGINANPPSFVCCPRLFHVSKADAEHRHRLTWAS